MLEVGNTYTVGHTLAPTMVILQGCDIPFKTYRFEAIQDEPDLASFEWYIPVTDQIEHDLVVSWLKSRGWSAMLFDEYDGSDAIYSSTSAVRPPEFGRGHLAKLEEAGTWGRIEFSFKKENQITEVSWPDLTPEISESDRLISELEATILEAQNKIEQLKSAKK